MGTMGYNVSAEEPKGADFLRREGGAVKKQWVLHSSSVMKNIENTTHILIPTLLKALIYSGSDLAIWLLAHL